MWGLPGDSPLAAVQQELQNLDIPHVLLNQREILETEVKLSVGEKITGENLHFHLQNRLECSHRSLFAPLQLLQTSRNY